MGATPKSSFITYAMAEWTQRAIISANSLAAEALGMADQIGSITPGLQSDIIALNGNPLNDITDVRRVVFVMKGGIIYKKSAEARFLFSVSADPTVDDGLTGYCTGAGRN